MSRIGKMPVGLPANVTAEINGSNISVTGPKGKLELVIDSAITAKLENNEIILTRSSEQKEIKAKHGLYRALIKNMVVGVSEGFKKTLVFKGVGYRLQKQGNKVIMNIGYSKPVEVEEIEGITLNVVDNDKVEVSGISKELVGQFASKIRDIKPVEPYHAYGIRYLDEVVIRKEGKKAAKK